MKELKPLPQSHKLMKFINQVLGILGESRKPEVYLIHGNTMRSLNRKFRGKDKTTDVLSFEYPEDFPIIKGEKSSLGEIYLNPASIKKNKETLEYIALHGLLHLLGFNHESKSDRINMERLERELLKKTNKSLYIK